ncbi:MAG: hypothetical protein HZB68_02280 [Candidatus Aenigmarchaeota archaeon]|nr:hypothetical protein [Candidatus Aenigmarchaeota archaeon]
MIEQEKRKMDMGRAALKTIVEIMQFIGERHNYDDKISVVDEKDIIQKFGKPNYNLFHKFCDIRYDENGSCISKYVTSVSSSDPGNNNKKIQLRDEGFRKYFELRQVVEKENVNQWIMRGTVVAPVFAGFTLVLSNATSPINVALVLCVIFVGVMIYHGSRL